jgi:hypothetical protein
MLGHPSWLKCASLVTNIVIFYSCSVFASTGVRQLSAVSSCNPTLRTGNQSPAGSGSGVRS